MMFVPRRLKELLDRDKKTQEEVAQFRQSIETEKGDFLAMVIAALITFLPVLAVIMFLFYGIIWLMAMR